MFRGFFATYRNLYSDFFYTKQLVALLSWIRTKQGSEEWFICLNLPRQKELIRVITGKANEVNYKDKYGSVHIIVCQSGNLEDSLKNVEHANCQVSDWYPLFTSRDLEVWENKNLYKTMPLRFGLSGEEKKNALVIARRAMERFLKNEKQDLDVEFTEPMNSLFREKTTVCVALWINGRIRGSAIERNVSLYSAIARGSARACRDSRFKPVIREELGKARIEITVMSDLKIPVTKKIIMENTIDTTVGYCIEKDGRIGWYVPEVFNSSKFKSLHELIGKLATRKAGILPETGIVSTFKVEDFIETEDKKRYLEMDGSVVRQTPLDYSIGNLNLRDTLVSIGTKASNQLVVIQELDGNIPPTLDPLTGERKQVGWVHLSCALLGMASFGKATGKNEFVTSAEKGFKYVSTFLYDHPTIPLNIKVASLIDLGRLVKILGKNEELKNITDVILEYVEKLTIYEPILYANIAGFLAEQEGNNKNVFIELAVRFAERVEMDYSQQVKNDLLFQLAAYPELALAFLYIAKRTGESQYAEKANGIFSWLAKYQLKNGSFPIRTFGPPSPYSRGTGKIFEVLSARYKENKVVVLKALSWLSSMQYDEDNLYFVKPELRNLISGGLRHDYLNQEVWIDGSAHLLIGISRILSQEREAYIGVSQSVDN